MGHLSPVLVTNTTSCHRAENRNANAAASVGGEGELKLEMAPKLEQDLQKGSNNLYPRVCQKTFTIINRHVDYFFAHILPFLSRLFFVECRCVFECVYVCVCLCVWQLLVFYFIVPKCFNFCRWQFNFARTSHVSRVLSPGNECGRQRTAPAAKAAGSQDRQLVSRCSVNYLSICFCCCCCSGSSSCCHSSCPTQHHKRRP